MSDSWNGTGATATQERYSSGGVARRRITGGIPMPDVVGATKNAFRPTKKKVAIGAGLLLWQIAGIDALPIPNKHLPTPLGIAALGAKGVGYAGEGVKIGFSNFGDGINWLDDTFSNIGGGNNDKVTVAPLNPGAPANTAPAVASPTLSPANTAPLGPVAGGATVEAPTTVAPIVEAPPAVSVAAGNVLAGSDTSGMVCIETATATVQAFQSGPHAGEPEHPLNAMADATGDPREPLDNIIPGQANALWDFTKNVLNHGVDLAGAPLTDSPGLKVQFLTPANCDPNTYTLLG